MYRQKRNSIVSYEKPFTIKGRVSDDLTVPLQAPVPPQIFILFVTENSTPLDLYVRPNRVRPVRLDRSTCGVARGANWITSRQQWNVKNY